ncbi:MAG: hypothetical protein JJU32_20030 [Phormidium sp. BM_Day4_Bin.17]|nr:hypothetical protein [Phormidium sp. BM_Day4_Bin.17]UCJ13601.1 MAG: hypothetical protein JWS08_07540 [Phormidium sp. PBR-2020]
MIKSESVVFQAKFFVYLGFLITSFIAYGYQLASDNLLNHFPYIDILLDRDLYPHDFYVQEFTRFSPRYYYQLCVVGLMSLGIPLSWIYLSVYACTYGGFVLGLFTLAQKFRASLATAALVTFLCLNSPVGTVGFVSLFKTEPVPAIWAISLTVWGFVFCVSRRWILGYFFFGLASLFQILVGVFPGILILPWLLKDAYSQRKLQKLILPLLILGIGAGAVYIPMKLTGLTGSEALSHEEFINIYGVIRHPHHIIFSQFQHPQWLNFWAFSSLAIFNCITLKPVTLSEKYKLLSPILAGLLILPLGYIFVEIYPITFFAKLQLARVTPFMQLFGFLGFGLLAQELFRKKSVGSVVLMATLLVLPNLALAPILLILILTNLWLPRILKIQSWIALGITASLLTIQIQDNPSQSIRDLGWLAILWGCLMIPAGVQKLESNLHKFQRISRLFPGLMYSIGLVPLLILIFGLGGWLPRPLQNPFDGRVERQWFHNSDLYRLGHHIQDITPKDSLILVPDSSHEFRAYSKRSVVFTIKSLPFSDAGIQEWFKRWQKMREQAPTYRQHSLQQLVMLAQEFEADYVLTQENWHPEIPYPVVAREGDWLLFQVPSSDSEALLQSEEL